MDDKIRGFVQSAIARALVERLFSLSGYNVRIAADWMFGTPENIGRPIFGDNPYLVIQPKRGAGIKSEYLDVRFRGNGGLYLRLDKQYVERWREWNKGHPLAVIVVSPHPPYFQAVLPPFFNENDAPLDGDAVMNISSWSLNSEVYKACVRMLLEYSPQQS